MPSFRVEGESPETGRQGSDSTDLNPDSLAPRSREDLGRRGRDRADRPEEDKTPDDPSFTNVFLNVGRRDGLRVEDVQRLLVEKAGLAEGDIGHVRLRDRITFVGIRKEHSERAIQAIVGVVVGDRTVNAEVARDR